MDILISLMFMIYLFTFNAVNLISIRHVWCNHIMFNVCWRLYVYMLYSLLCVQLIVYIHSKQIIKLALSSTWGPFPHHWPPGNGPHVASSWWNFIVDNGGIDGWVATKHVVKIRKFTTNKIIYLNSVFDLFYNMFSVNADNSCALFVDIPMFIIESTALARCYHGSGRLHNEIIMVVPLISVIGDAWLWYQSWVCHEHWYISCCE